MKKVLSVMLLITVILSSFTLTALASEEIIITTADALCKLNGTWKESTNTAVAGPLGGTSWCTKLTDATAVYDASKLEKGNYGVYLFVTPYGTTAPKIAVTITASGKATTLITDGLHGGLENRHWIFLGKYDFDGSTGDSVTQKIYEAGGQMRASGVKFVKDDTNTTPIDVLTDKPSDSAGISNSSGAVVYDEDTVIITPSDDLFKKSGKSWKESKNENVVGPTNGASLYTRSKDDSAIYDASKLEKGSYGVYLYLTPYGDTADLVDVTITASGKSETITTDGAHGGLGNRHWIFLGKYDFNGSEGDRVVQKLNPAAADGNMRASGVKFVKNDTNTAPIDSVSNKPSEPVPEVSNPTESIIYDEGAVIITTSSEFFKKVGDSWRESTNEKVAGPTNGTCWYTGSKDDLAVYDASKLEKGNYGVYLYLTPYGSTADIIDVTITASGKSETIITHGEHGGLGNRHWIFLGKYDFNGEAGESVTQKINSNACKGYMRTSGIKFVKDDTNSAEIDSYVPPYVSALFGTDLHIVERMGMLIGEGAGITEEYLDKVPTRVQAAIMVLRLNGVDAAAAAFTGTDNFDDASLEAWAMPYLAYLKAHPEFGLIGTGDNKFQPTAEIDEQAYAKILLTALGYEYNVDFTWDETLAFAKEIGIAKAESSAFTVKDLAIMTVSALNLNCKNGTPLLKNLVAKRDGVVDEGVYGTELTPELKAARDAAKNKKRGIIYNNDGNDVYKAYDNYPGAFDVSHLDGTTINAENFLKTRSHGLEDTQVGTVFYCTGVFNSYTHESSGVTDVRVRDWSRVLKQYTGKDSLETMIDYVHGIDRDIFWSMRMNDAHDSAYSESALDPWKKANMDLLMCRKEEADTYMKYGNEKWSCVNYGLTPVRQVVYDILKDTLTRYDIDGLELDFTRQPVFFDEVVKGYDIYPENIERMNNLIRMIRDLTEKISIERGKPILLAIYTYDSIELNKAIGLDIETWLEEDLIDIVSIGRADRLQSWEEGIAEYKDYDAKVFAAIDALVYKDDGADEYELNKNQAALAYAAGADGIYLYNYFDINHEMFDTLGSPETCGPVTMDVIPHIKTYGGGFAVDTKKYVTINK